MVLIVEHDLRRSPIFLKNAPGTGNGVGIDKTCFWAFARIDSWVVDEDPRSVADNGGVDDSGDLAILMFAKIITLCAAARNSYMHKTVAELWTQLQLWRRERSEEIRPLFRTRPSILDPKPTIIYSKSSASQHGAESGVRKLLLADQYVEIPSSTTGTFFNSRLESVRPCLTNKIT